MTGQDDRRNAPDAESARDEAEERQQREEEAARARRRRIGHAGAAVAGTAAGGVATGAADELDLLDHLTGDDDAAAESEDAPPSLDVFDDIPPAPTAAALEAARAALDAMADAGANAAGVPGGVETPDLGPTSAGTPVPVEPATPAETSGPPTLSRPAPPETDGAVEGAGKSLDQEETQARAPADPDSTPAPPASAGAPSPPTTASPIPPPTAPGPGPADGPGNAPPPPAPNIADAPAPPAPGGSPPAAAGPDASEATPTVPEVPSEIPAQPPIVPGAGTAGDDIGDPPQAAAPDPGPPLAEPAGPDAETSPPAGDGSPPSIETEAPPGSTGIPDDPPTATPPTPPGSSGPAEEPPATSAPTPPNDPDVPSTPEAGTGSDTPPVSAGPAPGASTDGVDVEPGAPSPPGDSDPPAPPSSSSPVDDSSGSEPPPSDAAPPPADSDLPEPPASDPSDDDPSSSGSSGEEAPSSNSSDSGDESASPEAAANDYEELDRALDVPIEDYANTADFYAALGEPDETSYGEDYLQRVWEDAPFATAEEEDGYTFYGRYAEGEGNADDNYPTVTQTIWEDGRIEWVIDGYLRIDSYPGQEPDVHVWDGDSWEPGSYYNGYWTIADEPDNGIDFDGGPLETPMPEADTGGHPHVVNLIQSFNLHDVFNEGGLDEADGSYVATVAYPDGSTHEFHGTGEHYLVLDNGERVPVEDGVHMSGWDSATNTISLQYPNGSVVELDPDGNMTIVEAEHPDGVVSYDYYPEYITVELEDGNVWLFDPETGEHYHATDPNDPLGSLEPGGYLPFSLYAVGPEGGSAAFIMTDGTIYEYDADGNMHVLQLAEGNADAFGFSTDYVTDIDTPPGEGYGAFEGQIYGPDGGYPFPGDVAEVVYEYTPSGDADAEDGIDTLFSINNAGNQKITFYDNGAVVREDGLGGTQIYWYVDDNGAPVDFGTNTAMYEQVIAGLETGNHPYNVGYSVNFQPDGGYYSGWPWDYTGLDIEIDGYDWTDPALEYGLENADVSFEGALVTYTWDLSDGTHIERLMSTESGAWRVQYGEPPDAYQIGNAGFQGVQVWNPYEDGWMPGVWDTHTNAPMPACDHGDPTIAGDVPAIWDMDSGEYVPAAWDVESGQWVEAVWDLDVNAYVPEGDATRPAYWSDETGGWTPTGLDEISAASPNDMPLPEAANTGHPRVLDTVVGDAGIVETVIIEYPDGSVHELEGSGEHYLILDNGERLLVDDGLVWTSANYETNVVQLQYPNGMVVQLDPAGNLTIVESDFPEGLVNYDYYPEYVVVEMEDGAVYVFDPDSGQSYRATDPNDPLGSLTYVNPDEGDLPFNLYAAEPGGEVAFIGPNGMVFEYDGAGNVHVLDAGFDGYYADQFGFATDYNTDPDAWTTDDEPLDYSGQVYGPDGGYPFPGDVAEVVHHQAADGDNPQATFYSNGAVIWGGPAQADNGDSAIDTLFSINNASTSSITWYYDANGNPADFSGLTPPVTVASFETFIDAQGYSSGYTVYLNDDGTDVQTDMLDDPAPPDYPGYNAANYDDYTPEVLESPHEGMVRLQFHDGTVHEFDYDGNHYLIHDAGSANEYAQIVEGGLGMYGYAGDVVEIRMPDGEDGHVSTYYDLNTGHIASTSAYETVEFDADNGIVRYVENGTTHVYDLDGDETWHSFQFAGNEMSEPAQSSMALLDIDAGPPPHAIFEDEDGSVRMLEGDGSWSYLSYPENYAEYLGFANQDYQLGETFNWDETIDGWEPASSFSPDDTESGDEGGEVFGQADPPNNLGPDGTGYPNPYMQVWGTGDVRQIDPQDAATFLQVDLPQAASLYPNGAVGLTYPDGSYRVVWLEDIDGEPVVDWEQVVTGNAFIDYQVYVEDNVVNAEIPAGSAVSTAVGAAPDAVTPTEPDADTADQELGTDGEPLEAGEGETFAITGTPAEGEATEQPEEEALAPSGYLGPDGQGYPHPFTLYASSPVVDEAEAAEMLGWPEGSAAYLYPGGELVMMYGDGSTRIAWLQNAQTGAPVTSLEEAGNGQTVIDYAAQVDANGQLVSVLVQPGTDVLIESTLAFEEPEETGDEPSEEELAATGEEASAAEDEGTADEPDDAGDDEEMEPLDFTEEPAEEEEAPADEDEFAAEPELEEDDETFAQPEAEADPAAGLDPVPGMEEDGLPPAIDEADDDAGALDDDDDGLP